MSISRLLIIYNSTICEQEHWGSVCIAGWLCVVIFATMTKWRVEVRFLKACLQSVCNFINSSYRLHLAFTYFLLIYGITLPIAGLRAFHFWGRFSCCSPTASGHTRRNTPVARWASRSASVPRGARGRGKAPGTPVYGGCSAPVFVDAGLENICPQVERHRARLALLQNQAIPWIIWN